MLLFFISVFYKIQLQEQLKLVKIIVPLNVLQKLYPFKTQYIYNMLNIGSWQQ